MPSQPSACELRIVSRAAIWRRPATSSTLRPLRETTNSGVAPLTIGASSVWTPAGMRRETTDFPSAAPIVWRIVTSAGSVSITVA